MDEATKNEANKRFQQAYDRLRAEGKHGHYETCFAAMHEAYAPLVAANVLDVHTLSEADAESGRMTWPWWMRGYPSTAYHGHGVDDYSVTFNDSGWDLQRAFVGDTLGLERSGAICILARAEKAASMGEVE